MTNKITFAVFGDVHGALDEMFEVCQQYNNIYQEEIDYILQTGDMEVWHAGSNLDKATKRFASKDPTELGCFPYISGVKKAPIPVIFIAGNHEDFDYLSSYSNKYIDPYWEIFHIGSGKVYKINKNGIVVNIAGLDGIKPRGNFQEEIKKKIGRGFYEANAIDRLLSNGPNSVDILLCHETSSAEKFCEIYPYSGSEDIKKVIEQLKPKYYFYGHYGHPPEPFNIQNTVCIGMNNPKYYQLRNRESNMAILQAVKEESSIHWSYKLLRKNEL